jgi:predicted transcriptional regulator
MSKAETQTRAQLLKQLREEYEDSVERLKEQTEIRRGITRSLQEGPKTVPAIAENTDLPAHQVLWHVMAMKKYGLLRETEMDGQYFQYELVKEKKQ